jgi:hypothetical protein
VHSEGGARPEARGSSDFTDKLGGGQKSTAGQRQQGGCNLDGPRNNLALESVDAVRQRADAGSLIARQVGNQAAVAGELRFSAWRRSRMHRAEIKKLTVAGAVRRRSGPDGRN